MSKDERKREGGAGAQTFAEGGSGGGEPFAAAMDKLRDEMAATKNNFTHYLGEEMTRLLQERPDIAPALLQKGKTLDGLYKAFYGYASKNRTGNAYAGTPEVARKLICEYYGVKIETDAPMRGSGDEPGPMEDPFDLDVLMGASGKGGEAL